MDQDYLRGQEEAEADIAAGVLALRTYGLPVDWWQEGERLVKERFGIEYHMVAGCVVRDDVVQEANGYNARMDQEITARFGPRGGGRRLARS